MEFKWLARRRIKATFPDVDLKRPSIVSALATCYRSSRHHPLAFCRVLPPRPCLRFLRVPDGGDKRIEQARGVAVADDPAKVVV